MEADNRDMNPEADDRHICTLEIAVGDGGGGGVFSVLLVIFIFSSGVLDTRNWDGTELDAPDVCNGKKRKRKEKEKKRIVTLALEW